MLRYPIAAIAALLMCSACVTRSSYNAALTERDTYREQLESLTRDDEDTTQALEMRSQLLSLREEELAELKRTREALETKLASEIASGEIRLVQMRDGLSVELSEDILFPSGSAELDGRGRKALLQVAGELANNSYGIAVRGHTDNVPIGPRLVPVYPSNWELAAARASRVVRLFLEVGIDVGRLSAVSYADRHPVASNDDATGRARNRRIDIRIRPVTIAE